MDPADSHHRRVFPVCNRLILSPPAGQTAWKQTGPLQWHALFCSHLHGHCDSAGLAISKARAPRSGLAVGSEHAGVDGAATQVPNVTRTAPESPAGEIATQL